MDREPATELFYIAQQFTGKMRDALLESYKVFLEEYPEERILQELKRNGVQGLLELAEQAGGEIADRTVPVLSDAWRESGRATISMLPAGAATAGAIVFDSLPVGAVSAAEAHRARYVAEASDQAREAVVQAVSANIISGNSPRTTARLFRSSIGLTAWQEKAVENYRNYLESLDPRALERDLRDKRYDRTIARHIDEDVPLEENYIDRLVERYRQRTLKWRSEMIARVESMRAINMGEYESLLAAFRAGKLTAKLKRFWVTASDERVRASHAKIPLMNKEGRGVEEPFDTPLGPLLYPLDPNGLPANVINCRCRVTYRLVSGTMPRGLNIPEEVTPPPDISYTPMPSPWKI